MKLSIIIVNYNVKYFLEQALLSVRKAIAGTAAEVWVVDNASSDGSAEMVQQKFPDVRLIVNKENVGFARANNQAIAQATGEYILLLNPDTVVEEDTFSKCVRFMDAHTEAGGLGVKMLDGSGNYLPESKRGFPSPWVAFCKAFGLTKLFPHSKLFAGYYLGHLSNTETHTVEVLAGAFMLIRKPVLDKIGMLDESFFMYGEDIDLSYRIIEAGFKNYYFPETRIIHYKGESTKKGSLNYVKMFYQAMIIFMQKHFKGLRAQPLIFLMQVAIYLRAFITLLAGFFKTIAWPLFDGVLIYGGMMLIKNFWQFNVKASEGLVYPHTYTLLVVPLYILVWLLCVYFNGGYDRPVRLARVIRGLVTGTIIISAIYGFLDESLRYSRAMIILGFAYSAFVMIITRWVFHFIRYRNFDIEGAHNKRAVIVGSQTEANRVGELLKLSGAKVDMLGIVLPQDNTITSSQPFSQGEGLTSSPLERIRGEVEKGSHILGSMDELEDIVSIYEPREIIFCSGDVTSTQIIDWMAKLGTRLEYKIVPQESMSIIGSHSKDLRGELYTIDITLNIDTPAQRRNKRILDIILSLFFLVFFWLIIWFNKKPLGFISNIFLVLFGAKTWVGFANSTVPVDKLPKLQPGVLNPSMAIKNSIDDNTKQRLNMLYAKDYNVYKDLQIVAGNMRELGNS